MKRDQKLSLEILKFIEEHSPATGGLAKQIEVEGYDRPTIDAHTELLIDGGFVDGQIMREMTGNGSRLNFLIRRLTNRGHDTIASALKTS